MPDVLILGGSGLIGGAIAEEFGKDSVLATYRTNPIEDGTYFDATVGSCASLIEQFGRPSIAVLLFAEAQIEFCYQNSSAAAEINIAATTRILDELLDIGVKPVFISTDVVFDGERGNYRECDIARPILEYGRQKLVVERYLEASGSPHLIVRLPKVVSSDPSSDGFFGNWIHLIESGNEILCAEDQMFSPVDVRDVAASIFLLVENTCEGLYHAAGSDNCSRADLFEELLNAIRKRKKTTAQMKRCSIRSFEGFSEDRPLDTTLDSSKLRGLGGTPVRSMEEVIEEAVATFYSK